jgi:3-hydroxyacyl-[acyl-carrier-protein] dehydratase
MGQSQIEEILPHRAPSLWIDRIEELELGVRCVAAKYVAADHPAFAGHFPGRPVLPGVFLIEAVAQTAGVMLGAGVESEPGGVPLLAAVNRFKFLQPVGPGCELRIETRKLTGAGRLAYIEGEVRVAGEIVARGELCVASA